MNRLIYFFALFSIISQPLFAQESGVPFTVDVSNRPTVLTLDFSTHDYELILYSFKTDETDYNRTFNFVVTGAYGASKPPVFYADKPEHRAMPTDRDRLDSAPMQINTALTESEFRPQTAVFPTADSLSTNSATASETGQVHVPHTLH